MEWFQDLKEEKREAVMVENVDDLPKPPDLVCVANSGMSGVGVGQVLDGRARSILLHHDARRVPHVEPGGRYAREFSTQDGLCDSAHNRDVLTLLVSALLTSAPNPLVAQHVDENLSVVDTSLPKGEFFRVSLVCQGIPNESVGDEPNSELEVVKILSRHGCFFKQ